MIKVERTHRHPEYMHMLGHLIECHFTDDEYVGVCSVSLGQLAQYGTFFTTLKLVFTREGIIRQNAYRFLTVCKPQIWSDYKRSKTDEKYKKSIVSCINWHNKYQQLYYVDHKYYKKVILKDLVGPEYALKDGVISKEWVCGYVHSKSAKGNILCDVVYIEHPGDEQESGYKDLAQTLKDYKDNALEITSYDSYIGLLGEEKWWWRFVPW